MRRSLVVGNWKMNGTRDSIAQLLDGLKNGLNDAVNCDVGVCPPFVYITEVVTALSGTAIQVGAQNVADQAKGAYTGEVAPAMLREVGCSMAIVGHSERRTLYGETDALVAARCEQAVAAGLIPILCIGETLAEREAGDTFKVLDQQLDAVIDHCGVAKLADMVIAYEPVWAIGTGRTASPEQAQEAHAYIRNRVAGLSAEVAAGLRILYGGSMNAGNAANLLAQADIDGGLIGGASLDPAAFATICKAA